MTSARTILATNRALSVFLLKMAAVYAVWFVLYDLWLLPDGRLDGWLSEAVASMTGSVLGLFYEVAAVDGRMVWVSSEAGVVVEDGCNGLSALSLFVGFVLAYPGTWPRRALFIPLGLVAIVAVNVLRCVSLVIVQDRWPELFGEVHGLHALFVFYVAIFVLWMVWAHWGGEEQVRAPAALA
ncbi:MAG: archaeosortase/exosortase family protein [Bacteroidota bacterium]